MGYGGGGGGGGGSGGGGSGGSGGGTGGGGGYTTVGGGSAFGDSSGQELPSLNQAPAGSIRFNTDSKKLEVYILGPVDDGVTPNGIWMEVDSWSPNLQTGGTRAVLYAGASPGRDDVIQYINVDTTGNSIDFGNAAAGNVFTSGGVGSRTRGVFNAAEPSFTALDFITFASTGNATSFGTITNSAGGIGLSNSTRGIFSMGGNIGIEYITIAATGNAVDFGDDSAILVGRAAASSSTRGVLAGGYGPSPYPQSNVINHLTISTLGNAADFGDLSFAHSDAAGASNSTRMLIAGGYIFPSPTTYYNNIEYVTIPTLGNSTDFGDLTVARSQIGGAASSTRGVFMGGNIAASPNTVTTIDYAQITSLGDAIDFGDLLANRRNGAGASNGHGGL